MAILLTVALHLIGVGAILALVRWLVVRPVARMQREAAEALVETRRLVAAINASDLARERQIKDGVETLERMRGAAADMIRQESRIIVEMALKDARKRATEEEREPAL
jgi:hypothetical protein